jgi:hypothetical protein
MTNLAVIPCLAASHTLYLTPDCVARSISRKKTTISFGSVQAPSSSSTKAASKRLFLSASVPDDTSTSIISIVSVRGFGKPG